MLGNDVPFFLTSATLQHNVLVEIMKVLGVSDSVPVKRRSNDRPNIHLCVRPMEHTLYSCFDIAFLVPLDAQINNCCRWEIEITQEEIYSTHTTKKAGYVVERDRPRYI